MKADLLPQAGKAGHGHRGPRAAEQGEHQGRAQAIAALADKQGTAQGGAVGPDAGQVVVHPPGQLGQAHPDEQAQPGDDTRDEQTEEQQPEVLPAEAGEHQEVGQPGQQGGEHHHRREAIAGAQGVDGVLKGPQPGADAHAADQHKIFRQQGGQRHPGKLNHSHVKVSFYLAGITLRRLHSPRCRLPRPNWPRWPGRG